MRPHVRPMMFSFIGLQGSGLEVRGCGLRDREVVLLKGDGKVVSL